MPMRNLLSQLLAVGPELAAFILTSPLLGVHAIPQNVAPSPNLDLSELGRVAVVGDFDSLSVYAYDGQNEDILNNNGSQSLLTQYDNGAFDSLALSDAYIEAMCQFERNGKVQGIVVGGNFTSLGGVEAQSIALWDPNSNGVTPLPGINGMVSSLYCDNDSGTVYVGGMFTAGESYNAMAWTTQWTNLPFAGFNGPVNSIAKNSAGNIVFGGQFDGLGNTTAGSFSSSSSVPNGQVINLGGGSITAEGSTTTAGFSDPSNIVCQTGDDTPGTTWLLADNRGGFWEGSYGFGFVPTKLRLYNTKYQGRGTKSFSFENLDNGGFLELNYTDSNGNKQSCASNCPLPQDDSTAQDFYFSNPVGFNNFRLWINAWYGSGGGFSGIEMFQDDIYSFAVNDFNEPTCDGVSQAAYSTVNPAEGLWTRIPNNGATNSDFLSAYLTDASQVLGTSVVFTPNVESSGNYSITMYTPGCLADNSCSTRGMVNVTGSMTSGEAPVSTVVTQTNDYDKYDLIYYGAVDTNSFAPSVTLSPIANQPLPQTIVAQRVRFDLVTTTGGLNGLYEYNPNKATVDKDFSDSAINSATTDWNADAIVNAVVTYQDQTIAAGNFTGNGISNIVSISSKAKSFSNGGLNDEVQALYLSEGSSTLYIGGNFTNTADDSVKGLANVASYDLGSDKWMPLGAGVDGIVWDIVPIDLNITSGNLEHCITINGDFSTVNAYGDNAEFTANGLAVWVPSEKDWLNNIAGVNIEIHGRLFSSVDVKGMEWPLYAGQAASQSIGLGGAAELVGSGLPSLQSFGVNIHSANSSTSSSKRKRAIATSEDYSGVYTGLFYGDNDLNITVFGGHFAATASDGSTVQNLLIVKDSGSKQTVSGVSQLSTNSTISALAYQDTLLFAGGAISGTIDGAALNGLVVYDLKKNAVASPQPPALAGDNVVVNAIAPQTDSSFVFVGGSFDDAGSLPCSTLCYYDTTVQQWNTPGLGLSGTITSMTWSSKTTLIMAGNLTVGGNKTTMATYDSKKQVFSEFTEASPPGAITALTPANSQYNEFWAAGIASNNNSAYLSYYSDDRWTGVGGLGPGTVIRGLQVLSLTSDHDSTDLVSNNQVLMVVGNINIPDYGNTSACLFNGTTFEPFILTNKDDGTQGSIASIFVSKPQNLMKTGNGPLAIGFVVLIGLAIALGSIFLIVVAGILIERARRRREGYVPMPSDKNNGNLSRIPPETLLGGLKEKAHAPGDPHPPRI